MDLSNDEESTTCGQSIKKSKVDMTDAESNTINSGKSFEIKNKTKNTHLLLGNSFREFISIAPCLFYLSCVQSINLSCLRLT